MDTKKLLFNENLIKQALYPCDSHLSISLKDNFFTSAAVVFSIIPHEEKHMNLF